MTSEVRFRADLTAQQSEYEVEAQSHTARVYRALDAAFARATSSGDTRVLDITEGRYIIFSDQHRGARNGADDFLRSERAYNAALAYYLHMGHTLIVLGDVEELWEETPTAVIKAYRHNLELEAQFHHRGRYARVWGNHDDEWQYADSVQKHLHDVYGGPPLHVHESLRFIVKDQAEELGTLFMLHGHQGDALSDNLSWFSRLFVRYIWRNFQRLTRISLNTPATSWDLRKRCNQALYGWAVQQQKLVLIAGHTHAPVFKSQSHEAQLTEAIERLKRADESDAHQEEISRLLAQREWVRAQDPFMPPTEFHIPMAKPCYFNTGCCCYRDGDITGIEIANGKIRLVRWPDRAQKPHPYILEQTDLRDVLAAC